MTNRCLFVRGSRGNVHSTLPLKCGEKVISARVTHQEMLQLKSDINKVPGERLGQLVSIIDTGESGVQHSTFGEIEVDFEMLKPSTLRALQRFVATCLTKSNQKSSSKCSLLSSVCTWCLLEFICWFALS